MQNRVVSYIQVGLIFTTIIELNTRRFSSLKIKDGEVMHNDMILTLLLIYRSQ